MAPSTGTVTRWLVGFLSIAAVVVGLALIVLSFTGRRSTPACPKDSVCDIQAQLRKGLQGAQAYYAQQHPPSFVGFNAKVAAAAVPDVSWSGPGPLVSGEVDITGVTLTTVVLVGRASDGQVFCLAEKGKKGSIEYGKAATDTASGCSGGW